MIERWVSRRVQLVVWSPNHPSTRFSQLSLFSSPSAASSTIRHRKRHNGCALLA